MHTPMLIDPDRTYYRVGLDNETTALLIELAEAAHCPPATLIASLVRGVLIDDAQAHQVHAGFDRPLLDS